MRSCCFFIRRRSRIRPSAEWPQNETFERLYNSPNTLRTPGNGFQKESHASSHGIEYKSKILIGNHSQDDSPRKTGNGTDETDNPLKTVNPDDAERTAADENDHDLPSDHDAVDPHKPEVSQYTFEDVELIIKSSVVVLVKNLHPYKCVENDSVKLTFTLLLVSMEDRCKDAVTGEK